MSTIATDPIQSTSSATSVIPRERNRLAPRWKESFRPRRLWGLAWPEWCVLSLYSAIALITLRFHEPWADEAQAWLIARDLPFVKMLLQVKYEGTPPLWHALLWVLIRLRLPYSQIGTVSAVTMIAAIYLWLRYSPVSWLVRYIVPFTFFLQYQHAVVARSYCLSTLLAFALAALWPARRRHLLAIGVLLALLCQTNLFGFVLAASLAGVLWLGLYRDRRQRPVSGERLQLWTSTLLVIASACVAAWLAHSPPDVSFTGTNSLSRIPLKFWWDVAVMNVRLCLLLTFGYVELGVLLLLAVAAWLAECKQRLYVAPFAVMLFVTSIVYAKSWHLGMLIVALLITVWLGWPEVQTLRSRTWTLVLSTMLVLCFLLQVKWTAVAVRRDIHEPYSGAKAAADFIRPLVGTRPIFGAHYHSIALLPYFNHNFFANQPSHSYWAWSYNDTSDVNVQTRRYSGPAIVVLGWVSFDRELLPANLVAQQFRLTHRYCGHLFMRDGFSEVSCYDIYERN